MTFRIGWAGILQDAVPDTATGAYGCRAIVDQDGMFDLVHDRQDFDGDPDVLAAMLARFPTNELAEVVGGLLRYGYMSTRRQETFVLYQDDEPIDGTLLTVLADTNASAGYCYVAAWVVRE